METKLHIVNGDQLGAQDLYAVLQLRQEVFVVEQQSIYLDLDDQDLKATTQHFWLADSTGKPLSYLRLFVESDGTTIHLGRVVTHATARSRGLSRQLLAAALAEIGTTPSVLKAQTHAAGLYASFGYTVDGPEYMEDGIPHVPMRRG